MSRSTLLKWRFWSKAAESAWLRCLGSSTSLHSTLLLVRNPPLMRDSFFFSANALCSNASRNWDDHSELEVTTVFRIYSAWPCTPHRTGTKLRMLRPGVGLSDTKWRVPRPVIGLSSVCRRPIIGLSSACRWPLVDLPSACRRPAVRLSSVSSAVVGVSSACRRPAIGPAVGLSSACRRPVFGLSSACRRACRWPVVGPVFSLSSAYPQPVIGLPSACRHPAVGR